MNEIIGIKSVLGFDLESLKKELFFFDKVHIVGLRQMLPGYDFDEERKIVKNYSNTVLDLHYSQYKIDFGDEESKYVLSEIEWLADKGKIILNDRDILFGRKVSKDMSKYTNDLMRISQYFLNKSEELLKKKSLQSTFIEMAHEIIIRENYCFFNSRQNVEAYPIVNKLSLPDEISSQRLDVIKVVIKNIPTLDKNIPWTDIFQFKEEEDTRFKFLSLRSWISDITSSKLNKNEIEEKIEYSFREYEKHLEINKMKYEKSILETVIVGGAELIENLLKLKIGNIAKKFFDYKQLKINVLESELKAPGKEIAYIDKIKREFTSSDQA